MWRRPNLQCPRLWIWRKKRSSRERVLKLKALAMLSSAFASLSSPVESQAECEFLQMMFSLCIVWLEKTINSECRFISSTSIAVKSCNLLATKILYGVNSVEKRFFFFWVVGRYTNVEYYFMKIRIDIIATVLRGQNLHVLLIPAVVYGWAMVAKRHVVSPCIPFSIYLISRKIQVSF